MSNQRSPNTSAHSRERQQGGNRPLETLVSQSFTVGKPLGDSVMFTYTMVRGTVTIN
jgi:hypothetical protein